MFALSLSCRRVMSPLVSLFCCICSPSQALPPNSPSNSHIATSPVIVISTHPTNRPVVVPPLFLSRLLGSALLSSPSTHPPYLSPRFVPLTHSRSPPPSSSAPLDRGSRIYELFVYNVFVGGHVFAVRSRFDYALF